VKVVAIKDYTMFHNNKGGTLSNQRLQKRPEMTECIFIKSSCNVTC